jgi:hypothetical protein
MQRRLVFSLVPEGGHGVNVGRPLSGDEAGQQCDSGEQYRHADARAGVRRLDSEEKCSEQARQSERHTGSQRQSKGG